METVSGQYSAYYQSASPSKQHKNPKRKNFKSFSKPLAGDFAPPHPSPVPDLIYFTSRHPIFYNNSRQPPLLPLPRVPSSSSSSQNRYSRPKWETNKKEDPKPKLTRTGSERPKPDPHKNIPKSYITEDSDRFSSLVFMLSPPPSSLPLPKFSIRPKISCNGEAVDMDGRATDNLRRVLRLR